MRDWSLRIAGAAFVAAVLVACTLPQPTDDGDSNTNTNNIFIGTPIPGASASPGVPGSTCAAIPRMRVNPFGYRCTAGPPPNNSSGLLPMDCQADVTATPFLANGEPAGEGAHGFNILWNLTVAGAGRARVADENNAFNKTVIPEAVGEAFTLTATLTPPGCTGTVVGAWQFKVVASGVRSGSADVVANDAFPPPPGDPPPATPWWRRLFGGSR